MLPIRNCNSFRVCFFVLKTNVCEYLYLRFCFTVSILKVTLIITIHILLFRCFLPFHPSSFYLSLCITSFRIIFFVLFHSFSRSLPLTLTRRAHSLLLMRPWVHKHARMRVYAFKKFQSYSTFSLLIFLPMTLTSFRILHIYYRSKIWNHISIQS